MVDRYSVQIEQSKDGGLRKRIRRERKSRKKNLKPARESLVRKQKYKPDEFILGQRNSYCKTDCDAPFRSEQQKTYVRTKLAEEETGAICRQRKIDVEPVFAFLKANLDIHSFQFTRKTDG